MIKNEFQKDSDQLKSSLLLLEENNKEIIMQDIIGDVKYIAFTTSFFNKLIYNQEIFIDATYKTNTLKFELYAIIGQIDGSCIPVLSYASDNYRKDGIEEACHNDFASVNTSIDALQNGLIQCYTINRRIQPVETGQQSVSNHSEASNRSRASSAMEIRELGGNIKKVTVQGFYERNIKKKDGYISTLDDG
ncbi:hypothetical protein GLOIN_2v1488634 [Rhizophagus clarus]|uniref:MULE transposase domain-containing protein n=1 Tax=Rhizophagus clarus TaxID=94130 RepID=A0A8H3LU57_9GLOM|nr:hypothetical protein GLOIN_2v1488634 [Rhizophagus clarus]